LQGLLDQRLDDGGVSVLSASDAKSSCAFPMIDNAAWVWASFAFSRAFSARNRSVSRSARDRRDVVADVFEEPFADPAGGAVLRARVHS